MEYRSFLLLVSTLFIAYACNHAMDDTGDESGDTERSPEAGTVELDQTQMRTAGIVLGSFETDTLRSSVEANGYIELLPNKQATINPPIEGFIERINCLEGQPVKKGALLFVLKHPGIIELQKNYIEAVNELNLASQEAERQKILSDADVSAQKLYQQAMAGFQTATAQKNAIAEQLRFTGINPEAVDEGRIVNEIAVYAPFEGMVSGILAHKGQLAGTGETVIELINTDQLQLKLNVFEQDMYKIKVSQKLEFSIPSLDDTNLFHANVSYVGKVLDAETHSIQVTAILSEYPELLPGVYVEASIFSDPVIASVLPDASIIREAEGEFVFKLDSDGVDMDNPGEMTFQRMEVHPGISENGYTEILNSGAFPVNATFVVKGAHYLKSELNKGEGDDD